MNTFARAVAAAFVVLGLCNAASALRLPPAEDCRALAARGGAFWMGSFSGTYEDFFDYRRPIAVRGCFSSEYACRRWINEIQTIVVNPGLMSCRPAQR
jgi:hypothetical protein